MYFVIAIWSTIFVIIRRFAPSIEARNKENKVICEKILGRDASEDDIEFCTLKLTLLKLEVEFFLCIFVFFEVCKKNYFTMLIYIFDLIKNFFSSM